MKYLFGPLPSRRLGYSLGIDIIPYKTCTFDCVYCEVGKTTDKTSDVKDFGNADDIITETKKFLSEFNGRIDHITFSGSGEPTLHSRLGYMAEEIRKFSDLPLALITNSSLLYRDDVRANALKFDVVLPSLDAASEETFIAVNKPQPDVTLELMLEGLKKFVKEYKGRILLEILFVKGINDSNKDILNLRKIIGELQIKHLQINTIVRPPAYDGFLAINEEDKKRIKSLLGDIAEIELVFKSDSANISKAGEMEVIALLSRRPCTFERISASLGIPLEDLRIIIKDLERQNKVNVECFNDEYYYRIKNA